MVAWRLSSRHRAPTPAEMRTVAMPENKSTAGSPAICFYFSESGLPDKIATAGLQARPLNATSRENKAVFS